MGQLGMALSLTSTWLATRVSLTTLIIPILALALVRAFLDETVTAPPSAYRPRTSSTARKTSSIMFAVSFPVFVFCRLG